MASACCCAFAELEGRQLHSRAIEYPRYGPRYQVDRDARLAQDLDADSEGTLGEPEVVPRIGPRSSPVGSAGVRLTRAGRVVASSGQTDVDGGCGRLTSRTASMLGNEPRCRSLAPWRARRAQVPLRDLLPPHPLRRPHAARRGDHRKDRGRADAPGRHPTPPVLTRGNLNAVTTSTEARN